MFELSYVPLSEFERVRSLSCSPTARTAIFATLCRINTLYMIMRAGSGHIGSSFSSLDIVSWLFLNELRLSDYPGLPRDIYFSSKGHDVPGLYSVLIGAGLLPFELGHSFRRLNGLPGHPDISIPFMETNTGPLGMGISKAKGMALANRLKKQEGNIYVLTGDGELQEGQIWESLPSAAHLGLSEITVIIDHNKVQSDTWVTQVSDVEDIEKKFSSFGWSVSRCNGHDLLAFADVMAALKSVHNKPKVVIADTIKGHGVSFMSHTAMGPNQKLYRYHSGAPSDQAYVDGMRELISTANAQFKSISSPELRLETAERPYRPSTEGLQRLVAAYSDALVNQAGANPHIVVLDADLVLDCGLIPFKERFPERFFECGIAEQDMVSQGGGMALKGLLPIIHSFACFLSARPNEQIYNNATERKKIVYVGSLAGLLPGPPGHSHQAVRDIAALSAIPGLIMIEPSCEWEVGLALDFCLHRTRESCYLRLVSVPCEVPYTLPSSYCLELGKGIVVAEGQDALMFAYGPVLLPQAFKVSKMLREQYGFGLKVVNLPWLNKVDLGWLNEIAKDYVWIFTLDNHYITGGQGSMIASCLLELGLSSSFHLKRYGVLDIPLCGQNQEVLRSHRLDAESLAEDIAQSVLLAGGQLSKSADSKLYR
jgi:transketolase